MNLAGAGSNGTLKWTDLAITDLLPVDEVKEEARRAVQARKMASGTSNNNPHAQAQTTQNQQNEENEEEENVDEEDEDGDDAEGPMENDDAEEEELSDGYE